MVSNKKYQIVKQQTLEEYIIEYDDIEVILPKQIPEKFTNNFDWATKNNQYDRVCTSPVKDQGTCGCCWACVVATLLDSAYYRQNIGYDVDKPPIIFSTQQIIDCLSAKPTNLTKPSSGCDGGFPIKSIDVYLGMRGRNMYTESQYPLISNNQMGSDDNVFLKWILKTFGKRTVYNYPGCLKYSNSDNSYSSSNSYKFNPIWYPPVDLIKFTPKKLTEDLLKKAIFYLGPIYISCQVPFRFQVQGVLFKNSIYSGELDSGELHAMVVTGWGTNEKGKYWIVQNSWGTSWGNNGFVWIIRDINYLRKYIREMAAIKIQRNCVDNSPENSIINIEISQVYQNIYPKVNNKNNRQNVAVLEFIITAYIPLKCHIDSIKINMDNSNEIVAANLEGLIDTNNNVIDSKSTQILVINNQNNYYYNRYGIAELPKNYEFGKRWFIVRKRAAWYGKQEFTSKWEINVKIKDNNYLEENDYNIYIDWKTNPVSISYLV